MIGRLVLLDISTFHMLNAKVLKVCSIEVLMESMLSLFYHLYGCLCREGRVGILHIHGILLYFYNSYIYFSLNTSL